MFEFFDKLYSRFDLSVLWTDILTCFTVTLIITMSVIIIGFIIGRIELCQLKLLSDKTGSKIASFICNRCTFPGTIIHELAHALFAVLTGAKVLKIKCFEMFAHGRLGHVDFALRGNKIKQMFQLSFISCAPVVVGMFLEYILIKVVFTYDLSIWIQILLWYLIISVADHTSMSSVDIKNYVKGLVLVFPVIMIIMLAVKYFLTVQ